MRAELVTGQVRVAPDELRQISRRFSARAAQLGGAIPGFDAAVSDVEEAFGLLGPSNDLYYQYLELARDSVEGLERLRDTLDGNAAGLSTAADNYDDAEAAATIPGLTDGSGD